jgi:hypothetical protein
VSWQARHTSHRFPSGTVQPPAATGYVHPSRRVSLATGPMDPGCGPDHPTTLLIDVFHLAYAAVLGWSPVTRKLLDRKRRSNPQVDLAEDGGRAIVIEEGIAAMAFA